MLPAGYITVREASEKTGLTRKHINYLLREGTVKGHKIETVWLVDLASLEAYIKSRPKPGPKSSK